MMNLGIVFLFLFLGLLILNMLSITISMNKGQQWKLIYVPVFKRTFFFLQIGVGIAIGITLFYDYVLQRATSQRALLLWLLWYALLNGLSAYNRWRYPMPPK